jgi:hypothetical protein
MRNKKRRRNGNPAPPGLLNCNQWQDCEGAVSFVVSGWLYAPLIADEGDSLVNQGKMASVCG